ncbi:cation:proton antiporter subunit C [Sanguibacter sp. Leaf3]|uniref:cation:proton antiporter subunit C n=1 Tax=Sanguibacter sp. Leaf3 TaxID=1736209 RepID=UPI0006F53A70|nr:cation:proton antiporter subunit C [Sanguibacter sp. Leaf3]KQU00200.1 cation:proton antiporter [Sanguibacter sp. Leaf3]
MTLALAAGVLVAGAVYLFSRREMLRVVLGFVLLGHAVNLVLMAAGGTSRRAEPIGSDLDPTVVADPLPQAFVLTAIVIAFSITIVMLVLAVTGRGDDDTADVPDDDRAEPDLEPARPTRTEVGA